MKKDIIKFLKQERGTKKVCIMGGHAPLISENEKVILGIHQEIKRQQYQFTSEEYQTLYQKAKQHPYMGIFPLETFKAAVKILNKKSRILLLVNDHQFIDKLDSGIQEKNPWRDKFFQKNELPIAYELELACNKKCPSDSVWNIPIHLTINDSTRYMSEYILRKKFKQKKYASCSLESGCSQIFYPLLEQVYQSDFEMMINFIPMICTEPILEATAEFRNLPAHNNFDVVNIFLNSGLPKNEMWKKAKVYINLEKQKI